jgi:hypothetical protein
MRAFGGLLQPIALSFNRAQSIFQLYANLLALSSGRSQNMS